MDITTVIINYQTPDLLEVAVRSFKKIYPEVALLIADNGSEDNSKQVIKDLTEQFPLSKSLFLDKNIYHGPAMDLILKHHINTSMAFFLDSDTKTKKAGFLEKAIATAADDKVYAVGEKVSINHRGFKDANGFEVLLTPYMLIKKKYYEQLSPFVHHGQPTIYNFYEAQKQGLILAEFPMSEYIFHHWRGTASRFGYGLGVKGKIDYLLNKIGL